MPAESLPDQRKRRWWRRRRLRKFVNVAHPRVVALAVALGETDPIFYVGRHASDDQLLNKPEEGTNA